MLPHELADDACSLRPHQDRLCVTVEMPPGGEPVFYRSVINSNARLTYGQAQRREATPEIVEQLDLAARGRDGAARAARFARGALEINVARDRLLLRRTAASPDAWRESRAARAHARRGADDPRERARRRLPRGPAPRSALPRARAPGPAVALPAARAARRPRGADAARARADDAAAGRRARGRRSHAVSRSTSSSRAAGGRRSRRSSCARSSRRGTHPRTSATPASRAPRTATSPRRSAATPTSSSTGRSCASSASPTTRFPSDLRGPRRARLGARAGGGAARVPRRRPLPRLAPRGPPPRARLGRAVGGRDRRARSARVSSSASARCSRGCCRRGGSTASSTS